MQRHVESCKKRRREEDVVEQDDDDNDDCDDDDHDNFCAQRIILNETLPQAKSPCMSVEQIC